MAKIKGDAIPDEIDADEDEDEDEEPEELPDGFNELESDEEFKRKLKYSPIRQRTELARSIQEQPFNNLVVIIMNLLSATQPRQYVKLYQFTKILAKRLNEPAIVKQLDEIFKGVTVLGANNKSFKIPLSILQYVYDRDSQLGYSPTKSYQKKQITLAGVIIALDQIMETMIDFYTQMCDDHNIALEQSLQPPSFASVSPEDLPSVED